MTIYRQYGNNAQANGPRLAGWKKRKKRKEKDQA